MHSSVFPNILLITSSVFFISVIVLIGSDWFIYLFIYLFLSFSFFFFLAISAAYGSSQGRGQIGAAAARLYHRHINARSEPCLGTTSQLMAMTDP